MTLIDISRPFDDRMPAWPGNTAFHREVVSSLERGEVATTSNLTGFAHTGTHVDAPCHFVPGGSTFGEVPLDPWIGSCLVVVHDPDRDVTAKDLESWDVEGVERLLISTRNAARWDDGPDFRADYLAIDASAAQAIVDRGIKLIGIDGPSIEVFEGGEYPVHRTLLGAGVAIIEGLRLEHVEPGAYELIALPLLIAGGDGSPVRAILRAEAR